MPAVVVEELPSARAKERKDVLEVRRGARRSAECRRIERASPRGEEEDARQAAADLEPTRAEVSVRNAIARDVENRPQKECCEPRAAGRPDRSACRHVEGNYHGRLTSRMPAALAPPFESVPRSARDEVRRCTRHLSRRRCPVRPV